MFPLAEQMFCANAQRLEFCGKKFSVRICAQFFGKQHPSDNIMSAKKQIVFMVGGVFAEAVASFLALLAPALDDRFTLRAYEGEEALKHLGRCDILVLAGYHDPGTLGEGYQPLSRMAKQSFGAYVSSGNPLVVTAEGAASFPEWPRYGELVGFGVQLPERNATNRLELYAEPATFCQPLSGVVLERVPAFRGFPRVGMESETLLRGRDADGDDWPLVMVAQGGPRPGAGLSLFMGPGPLWRDILEPATLVQLWRHAMLWLVGEADAVMASDA
jgi:hypothetical protein